MRPLPWPAAFLAAAVAVVLTATAGRYGYHRDELYFVAAGHHLAWGYPDQPPFVPAVARLMTAIAPSSLVVLRLPSAIAAGLVVSVTARLAAELGGGRAAQILAAAVTAVAALLLGAGHLLSTTTFGLLAWTVLLLLVVRILRTGNDRLLLVVGVVAGIGLLESDLVAFLLGALAIGALISGPRRLFRSKWLWLGALVAIALWTPYLVWQARNGWPQLSVSRSIASGGSGTSAARWTLLPFQFVLVSVFLAPVWIAGLWRLCRDPLLRWARPVGWAWVVLLVVFTVSGGKPYYLALFFPVLVAAGAQPTIDWTRRGRSGLRRVALGAALVLSLGNLAVALPLVPQGSLHRTPIVALDYDSGETVGWPAYVDEIAGVVRSTGGRPEVLASNYGEAGAVDRYGPARGLPPAWSGHMGFWWWGPPPGPRPDTVVAVGFGRAFLLRSFTTVVLGTRLDNHLAVDDDEQAAPVWVCSGMRADWSTLWPRFKNLG